MQDYQNYHGYEDDEDDEDDDDNDRLDKRASGASSDELSPRQRIAAWVPWRDLFRKYIQQHAVATINIQNSKYIKQNNEIYNSVGWVARPKIRKYIQHAVATIHLVSIVF